MVPQRTERACVRTDLLKWQRYSRSQVPAKDLDRAPEGLGGSLCFPVGGTDVPEVEGNVSIVKLRRRPVVPSPTRDNRRNFRTAVAEPEHAYSDIHESVSKLRQQKPRGLRIPEDVSRACASSMRSRCCRASPLQ